MKPQHRDIKVHLELTTASLLAQQSQCASLYMDLPEGSLLLLVPKNDPKIRQCLLKVAEDFRKRGGHVVICCCVSNTLQKDMPECR